eukprot:Skav230086  [mRNA]  locus=scaffold2569:375836:384194:- [translate_table: standard]
MRAVWERSWSEGSVGKGLERATAESNTAGFREQGPEQDAALRKDCHWQAQNGESQVVDVEGSFLVDELKAQLGLSDETLCFGGQSPMALPSWQEPKGGQRVVIPRLVGGGGAPPAMGKRHKKTHGLCPRCGKRSYHIQNKRCAACGFPAKKIRSYNWSKKATRGTSAWWYVKHIGRRFKNGFREGGAPPARKKRA